MLQRKTSKYNLSAIKISSSVTTATKVIIQFQLKLTAWTYLWKPEKTTAFSRHLVRTHLNKAEQTRGLTLSRNIAVAVVRRDCERLFFSEQAPPFCKDLEVMMTQQSLTRVSQNLCLGCSLLSNIRNSDSDLA